MRMQLAPLLVTSLCVGLAAAPPVAAQSSAPVARFAPPADQPLRYRVEAQRDWRGEDVPPLRGSTRYDVELRLGPPGADGSRRMTWQLLDLVQQGSGPAAGGGAPGVPDIAEAVAAQLRRLPVLVDLFASGAIRGIANWREVAAAFDRAARSLAGSAPASEAMTGAPGAVPRDAAPGPEGEARAGPEALAAALGALGEAEATDLLLRDLSPLFGWGGLAADGRMVADLGRLRIAGLGAEAIARRERSLVQRPDGSLEGRLSLRPAGQSLAETVRAASEAAPRRQPQPARRGWSAELRRLAEADMAETALVRLDPASGLPLDARIERTTRADGLFEQREEVTIRRLP